MKRALSCFLAFSILFASCAVSGCSESAQGQKDNKPVSLLILFTLDKKLPASGKTNTMAHYIATFDEESHTVRFTTLPYNLAVDVVSKGAAKQQQLQFVCKESGVEATIDVLQKNFGITIDYWIMTNMYPVPGLVDSIGGISVDLASLSINDKGNYVKSLVGKPWVKVAGVGRQTLSGVQAVGYLVDTTYGNPTIEEEELRFRERQEAFTSGVISGMRNLRLNAGSLIEFIDSALKGSYSTNITIKGLLKLAAIDAACFDNPPQYLHIPREIFTVKAANGWESLGYTTEDAAAVREFTGQ